jgi:thioredoxin-dependent peroxiredoxin
VLSAGDPAPDFTVADQNGDELTLSSLRGQTVVLYFYPRADTSGCTIQACGVRDHRADYERAGARVIGVSPDPVEAIAKFAGKHDLDFTLLADPDHTVAELYGTWVEKRTKEAASTAAGLGYASQGRTYWGVQRATFVIDPEGTIAHVIEKASPKTHDDEVLGVLAQATET